jgi:DNA-binding beta-propeller fold protein YncE
VYVADTDNSLIRKIASTGPVTTFAGSLMSKYLTDGTGAAAMFNYPNGIIVDKASTTLYVADTNNNAIRGILISNAQVYTVAGASTFSGQVDGPTATARFSLPTNVAVDAGSNIFVTDNAALIRKIVGTYSASGYTGTVTTLAGFAGIDSFGDGPALGSALVPKGIAVDASGNVFTTDGYNLIRKYTP